VIVRFFTVPKVRDARVSAGWALVFIAILYTTAPAVAAFARLNMIQTINGTDGAGALYAEAPSWIKNWEKTGLIKWEDKNGDGRMFYAKDDRNEMTIDRDIMVLANPEIAKLPAWVIALVAAGGLAAALSTADGLLLTIANALSHDLYYKMLDPHASTTRRVTVSKILLLVVALIAAFVTSMKPGDILFLVGAAFSLAASSFFPALVIGVFWKRANKWGAIVGMIAGLGTCMYYMVQTYPFFGGVAANQWFDMSPVSAGVFGVPVGIITTIVVSMLTSPPPQAVQEMVDHVRYPHLRGDTISTLAR
jgi:cation/acetate symporter